MAKNRGPYSTKRKLSTPDESRGLSVDATYEEFRDRALEESPIKSEAAKLAMCEALSVLRIEQGILIHKLGRDTITAEELRQIPGVASNIRRICESLGIVEHTEDEISFGDV